MADTVSNAVSAVPANEKMPTLSTLAAIAFSRDWVSTCSVHTLERLPLELAKVVWKQVRALLKRQDRALVCKYMFPFVHACWHVEALDLTDGGRWVTDGALAALATVTSLRSVRLTACRFITDTGLSFCSQLSLRTLDVSWTELSDASVGTSVRHCTTLTSLNLTGLRGLTDAGVSSLLSLTRLERLSLASTAIGDAAVDYLTYYTRFPDAGPATMGVHGLRWLELSNTRVTDAGVGKLVAVIEDGTPYGKVFKELEYLALSSTPSVTPSAVRQVRTKYGFDAPLPNAQRTLAKSNAVALEAQQWILRLSPEKMPAPNRTWEQDRLVAYVAQYTKEMAGAADVIRRLTAADHGGPPINTSIASRPCVLDTKRQRIA